MINIVFEGSTGSGKTTLIRKLYEEYKKDYKVGYTNDIDETSPLYNVIMNMFSETPLVQSNKKFSTVRFETMVQCADYLYLREKIYGEDNDINLLDRNFLSVYSYQSVLVKKENLEDGEQFMQSALNCMLNGERGIDLLVYFNNDFDKSIERTETRDNRKISDDERKTLKEFDEELYSNVNIFSNISNNNNNSNSNSNKNLIKNILYIGEKTNFDEIYQVIKNKIDNIIMNEKNIDKNKIENDNQKNDNDNDIDNQNENNNKNQNRAIVISGPSGAGKSTFVSYLEKRNENYKEASGFTTRPRRENEVGKITSVSKEEFTTFIENDEFIEHCEYNNNYYGIKKEELNKLSDHNLIFTSSYASAKEVKKLNEDAILIYLLPENCNILLDRLSERKDGAEERFTEGIKETLSNALNYDYLLVSKDDDFEGMYNDFIEICNSAIEKRESKFDIKNNEDFISNFYDDVIEEIVSEDIESNIDDDIKEA